MTLEDELNARREALAAGRRIEAHGADCLAFAVLAAEVLDDRQAAHVSRCERCRTLRERLLQAAAEEPWPGPGRTASRQPAGAGGRRVLRILTPLASAACVVLAAWLVFGRPAQMPGPSPLDARLRNQALDSTAVMDGALRILGDQRRTSTDIATLEAENAALRRELQRLIDHLETLLTTARAARQDGAE